MPQLYQGDIGRLFSPKDDGQAQPIATATQEQGVTQLNQGAGIFNDLAIVTASSGTMGAPLTTWRCSKEYLLRDEDPRRQDTWLLKRGNPSSKVIVKYQALKIVTLKALDKGRI
jgi:hypothetical protein